MITFVGLENWQAYSSLELDLEPGTTFLVASNGVGKTSLIDAIRWALDPRLPAQADMLHESTTKGSVEVRLMVGERRLRIRRTLIQGKAKVPKSVTEAWVDSDASAPADAFSLLEQEWGAEHAFLARAAFVTDRFLYADEEPDLRSHLGAVYGLTQLKDAINQIELAIAKAKAAADEANKGVSSTKAGLAEADARVRETAAALDAAGTREEEARLEADETTKVAAAAEKAVAAGAKAARWRARRDALASLAQSVVGDIPADSDLRVILRAAETATRAQAEDALQRRAALTSRIEMIETELGRLQNAEGECPTCRRPLDDSSRDAAEHLHRSDEQAIREELESVGVEEPTALVARIRDLLSQADELGEAPPVPDPTTVDLDDVQARATSARSAHESAVADKREAEVRHATAGENRDMLGATVENEALLPRLYRRQALLEAAGSALQRTIDEVLDSEIGPIRDEVNRRWEAVFPDRPGLRLSPDGTISRPLEDRDLKLSAFSSGERMMAKLLVRLGTLVKTTKVPFCWIDEPLEHLDPNARRFVASTLAHLSEDDALSQIFVTTYEEPLAAALIEHSGDRRVHLHYLRTTPSR